MFKQEKQKYEMHILNISFSKAVKMKMSARRQKKWIKRKQKIETKNKSYTSLMSRTQANKQGIK